MGITQIIDPFYQSLDLKILKNKPVVGQFCRIAVTHLDKIPRILEVARQDPTEHYATKFQIRNMIARDFRKKQKLPVMRLTLRETEELIIQRAKNRLAVVVAANNTIFDDVKEVLAGREHLQDDTILAVPLYGIESAGHEGGFPAAVVARVKALMYHQFFYCPGQDSVYEGVIRLDRIQPVIPLYPGWIPEKVALSEEALAVLMGMLREYFGGAQDEDLRALRELVQDALPDEAKP